MKPDAAKKPGLAAVAESLSKKPAKAFGKGSAPMDDDEDEDDAEYDTAVDELYDALKSGDRQAFGAAFRAAVGGCK